MAYNDSSYKSITNTRPKIVSYDVQKMFFILKW